MVPVPSCVVPRQASEDRLQRMETTEGSSASKPVRTSARWGGGRRWRSKNPNSQKHVNQLGGAQEEHPEVCSGLRRKSWCMRHQRKGTWIDNAGVKLFAAAHNLTVFISTAHGVNWSISGGGGGEIYLKRNRCYAAYEVQTDWQADERNPFAAEGEENLAGGAPKRAVSTGDRSRSPRREPDFNLAREEGWTVDIQLQDRNDCEEEKGGWPKAQRLRSLQC